MNGQIIYIYQDYIHSTALLERALRAENLPVRHCDAGDIAGGCLEDGARLLVMPGGADLYYYEKLNGPGRARLPASHPAAKVRR